MRIYMNPVEAFEETKRDLAEMGITVKPKSYQNKNIEGDVNFETKELQNYSYSIENIKSIDIPGVSQPWADAEFEERVYQSEPWNTFSPLNPGKAYKLRNEIWEQFLNEEGKFDYSYNERLNENDKLFKIINQIRQDSDSRQLWLSLWDPNIDPQNMGGKRRVPCSLGYNFQVRDGKLNIHYMMRSCDFATHFRNDVYLAIKLLEYVADKTGHDVGSFTHTIFSLHIYKKDIQGVF